MEILNKTARYASLLILPLLVSGCYEDVALELASDPVLCLNSIITAGEPVEARVTHTWYYSQVYTYDNNHKGDVTVRDAEVRLYADGELKETLTFTDDLTYRGSYCPAPGETIRIEAVSPVYGDASGEVVIPPSPEVGTPEYTATATGCTVYRSDDDPYTQDVVNLYLMLDITLPLGGGDGSLLYYIGCSTMTASDEGGLSNSELWLWDFNYNAEPLFSEHISGLEAVFGGEPEDNLFFTSHSFAGRTYPLRLIFNGGRYSSYTFTDEDSGHHASVRIGISSVSQSYYNWMMYSWKVDNGINGTLGDIGYAEDMAAFSNVSTHAGIIAARTVEYRDVDLHDFIDEQVKKATEEN